MDIDSASAIALQGLAYLASDTARLSRFLALTGTGPSDLARLVGETSFQGAVLDHLLRDESLMLQFCANNQIRPDDVAPAFAALSDDPGEFG